MTHKLIELTLSVPSHDYPNEWLSKDTMFEHGPYSYRKNPIVYIWHKNWDERIRENDLVYALWLILRFLEKGKTGDLNEKSLLQYFDIYGTYNLC